MKSGRLSLLEQSQHKNIKCATYSVTLVGKKKSDDINDRDAARMEPL